MSYCTKEQIEAARAMDILTYLRLYEPENLKPFGRNGYCLKDHDSLKISNGKWYWWSRGIGGKTALDYLVSVRNVPFTKAVEMLCSGNVKAAYPVSKPRDRPRAEFIPPEKNNDNGQVTAYLMKRGIDKEIIDYCIGKGLLYEDRQYHNAIFAGYNAEKQMKYAFKRSTYANSTFMGEVGGSDKRYSFSIQPKGAEEKTAAVFESAIDALSYAALLKMEGLAWEKCRYLSLGGVHQEKHSKTYSLPLALEWYLKTHPQTDTLILALDSDESGQKAAVGIQKALEGTKTVCVIQPPKDAKDYNELLTARKGLKSTVKTRGAACGEIAR